MAFPAQLVFLKETWKPVRVAIVNGSHADEGAVNDAQAPPPGERGRESHDEVTPITSYYVGRRMWASISSLPAKPAD